MGVQQHMVGRREMNVDSTKLQVELYTDASKRYGVGGVLGVEVLSQRWDRDVSGEREHIGSLELEAMLHALRHWKHDLAGVRVLARMDNIQAVTALNKGASRIPALRTTLLHIALLGLEYGFEVKAKHVKGVDNPADAPSRGTRASSTQDYTFAHFQDFNQVDCCAAASGYNAQPDLPGCTEWFSSARPVQEHVPELAGKRLWANVPFALAGPVLDAVVAAWQLAPSTTVATCVVPEWTTMSWFRRYIRRKTPLFKVLCRYPAGSRLFYRQGSRSLAGRAPSLFWWLGWVARN